MFALIALMLKDDLVAREMNFDLNSDQSAAENDIIQDFK